MLNSSVNYIPRIEFVGEISDTILVNDSIKGINDVLGYTKGRYPVDISIDRSVEWEEESDRYKVKYITFNVKACFYGFYTIGNVSLDGNVAEDVYCLIINNRWDKMNPRIIPVSKYEYKVYETLVAYIYVNHQWKVKNGIEPKDDGVVINDIYLGMHSKSKNPHSSASDTTSNITQHDMLDIYNQISGIYSVNFDDISPMINNGSINIDEILISVPKNKKYDTLVLINDLNEYYFDTEMTIQSSFPVVVIDLTKNGSYPFYAITDFTRRYNNSNVNQFAVGCRWLIGSVEYFVESKILKFNGRGGETPYIMPSYYVGPSYGQYVRGKPNGNYNIQVNVQSGGGFDSTFPISNFISRTDLSFNQYEEVDTRCGYLMPSYRYFVDDEIEFKINVFERLVFCNSKSLLGTEFEKI